MSGRNGFHKVTYGNGSVYEGEWKNGKKHGRCKETWSDGTVYEGEWKDDKRHGRGKYTFASGNVYEGEFKDNNMHGRGKYTFASGNVYEGEYKDNSMTGRGKFTAGPNDKLNSRQCDEGYKAHSVYEGEYHEDKRHGVGILTEDGVSYRVKYSSGKQTSKTRTTPALPRVTAQLSHGARIGGGSSQTQEQDQEEQAASVNGFHKVTWANGNVYEGGWKDNKFYGQGKYTWSDGDVYEGEYKDDVQHGQGKFTAGTNGSGRDFTCDEGFKAHSVYEGGYHEGKRHGVGILTEDGVSYSVEYSHGKQTSKTNTAHSVYEGGYHEGKRHGVGILTEDGGSYSVEYSHGKQTSKINTSAGTANINTQPSHGARIGEGISERNGFHEVTYNNGDVYEGEWKAGNLNGQGKFTAGPNDKLKSSQCDEGYKANSVYEGLYHENKRHGAGILTEDGVSYSVKYSHGKQISKTRRIHPAIKDLNLPRCTGWIQKEGGRFKTWKRRWLVLHPDSIQYFENSDDLEPKGTIPVRDLSVLRLHAHKRQHAFELVLPDKGRGIDGPRERSSTFSSMRSKLTGEGHAGHYVMTAESETIMKEWIDSIQLLAAAAEGDEALAQMRRDITFRS
eukprot:UC1_evm1s1721